MRLVRPRSFYKPDEIFGPFYTNGTEFVLYETGEPYVGWYIQYIDNFTHTGVTWDGTSKQLVTKSQYAVKLYTELGGIQIPSVVGVTIYTPPVIDESITITRYFIYNEFDNTFIEVDSTTFGDTSIDVYRNIKYSIEWMVRGEQQQVRNFNTRQLQQIPNKLRNYSILQNPLLYYQN